ncbi:DNA-processing protein DprA [Ketogulonicigenium vulgare]|nr:DNA-processing protein DprA [Ketogulonicigenium vulgare]ADO42898.1 DNA processing protein DprA, putative [Ketogulonicigenium vulgare Y25]ALJ81227.1 DNA processing protein DprA [Ketogulonicigenium vulgare]ANW33969.1 DNA protecting protein DprA [Ketogulonicigenium vulgare]AOZ54808.1 DNA processing protein DprA [Ketogulonicigenium vulgare]
MADDPVEWLQLYRSRRVGAATFWRLLRTHGSAGAALAALPEMAAAAGVTDYAICPVGVARAELRAGARAGARLILGNDPDYPLHLRGIPDAPPVLWALGDIALLRKPAVALIGARNASSLGIRMAAQLAGDLGAAGLAVVSGLARGIDAAAHRAALSTGTIAVLGTGIDRSYPNENTALAREIAAQGLLLSELPPGAEAQARHFPARNRIVSGLSRAVVVVEAAVKSGSLLTARDALDQGRDVMAVPGHPLDARAGGCNLLLRDGALLVRDAHDVREALSIDAPPPQAALALSAPLSLADPSARILAQISASPVPEHVLRDTLGIDARSLSLALIDLELDGAIHRPSSGLVALGRQRA